MRPALLALAALLACARLGGARGDDEEREVRVAGEPLSAEQQARLVDHARAGGLLWWRLPGEGGYRCEPWRLVPDPGDPGRGRLLLVASPVPTDSPTLAAPADPDLASDRPVPEDSQNAPPSRASVPEDSLPITALAWPVSPPAPADGPAPEPAPRDMSLGTSTIQLGYHLAEGHLTLTAPEHELPVAAPPGTQKAVGHALTCVFTGIALGGPAGGARRLILAARERFFFSEEACAAAGFADDPPGLDELRTVGCAGALADPATRARLERPPPRDAPDAAARLHRVRNVHHLRRGPDGALVCDVWRNRPARSAGHGRLEHRGRDERGRFVRTYAYDVGPGYLTLQGPAEFRRIELDGQRTDVVRASSCLVTRGVTRVDAAAIDLGGERWYLSRSACDAARLAGAPAPAGAVPLLVPGCE